VELKAGDKTPIFAAKDVDGVDFDSQNRLGQKPLVVCFYPKDNALGCTVQTGGFRGQYEDFKA